MGLKLLHLSDIHFIKNDKYDLDEDIRNEIERDLRALLPKFNNIDAVLIGGDVAYSASHEEYENAYSWIKKVCGIIGCDEINVLTIPGNHDVERRKICAVLEPIHTRFKSLGDRTAIDDQLKKFLIAPESCETLLKPFENYEKFAQRYSAIPKRDSPLYWEKDLQLNGAKLRIRGINSSFVSNNQDNIKTSKLIVGSHQSNLKREDGVIYCVLCHHPPDWLNDGDETERDFLSRAKLHLYGHKHKMKVLQQNQSLKLSAGAMHPSRAEQEWEPRYNIIDLQILKKNNKAYLEVILWKRVWHKENTCFVADFSKNGSEFERYELELEPTEIEMVATTPKPVFQKEKSESLEQEKVELIDTNTPNPMRKLKYMFFSLPYQKKLKVAVILGLIEDEDTDLNEVQKTQAYFDRAEKKNMLKELWDNVAKEGPEEITISNPFKTN